VKFASLKAGRDGRLVVVSRDLARAADAGAIAGTLQAALDDWAHAEPKLANLATALDDGLAPSFPFYPQACGAPLPRAYQWADGSSYVNHVELVRRARGAQMPASFWSDPLLYQGGSDGFLGPCDPIPLLDEAQGLDLEAEVAVVTDDVPMAVDPLSARAHIKLFMLVNDVSLRELIPAEVAKGFGFFQSKPASAFSSVAVTPDELGEAWREAKVCLPLLSFVNGAPLGRPDAGRDMTFDFGRLVAHAAFTRALGAGTIIGSGTVSNRGPDGGPGRPIAGGGVGYSCLAEQRVVETLLEGAPRTRFLAPGDVVRIEMLDLEGRSIFGSIEQRVMPHAAQNPSRGNKRSLPA
jgi:fumarylacetoacetate (FAA) hydrolase